MNEYDEPAPPDGFASSASYAQHSAGTSSGRPFLTIWFSPRRTIRRVLETDPDLHVSLLVCLAGMNRALSRASNKNLGDNLSLVGIFFVVFVAGPLGGMFTMWLYSNLIAFSGKWLGGQAGYEEIKPAYAWATAPMVISLALWIPLLFLFGREMFQTHMPRLQSDAHLAQLLLGILKIQVALGIWMVVIMCNTIAEVQGFRSAWTGLANMLLAALLLAVPVLLIVLGVWSVRS